MLKALGSIPSTSKMTLLQLMNLVSCSLSPSSRNLRQEDHAKTDSCETSANACLLLFVVYVMSDMFKVGQVYSETPPSYHYDLIWSTFSVLKKKKKKRHYLQSVLSLPSSSGWSQPVHSLFRLASSIHGSEFNKNIMAGNV